MTMMRSNMKSTCRDIRRRLAEAIEDRLVPSAGWMGRHLAGCPRCRRRLGGFGKVSLALLLIKSQAHRADLLMRANRRAVAMLKRNTRRTTEAEGLRHMLPRVTVWLRIGKYTQSVASVAACLLIVLLMRMDLLSSAIKFHRRSEQAIKGYYTRSLGEEISNDLF